MLSYSISHFSSDCKQYMALTAENPPLGFLKLDQSNCCKRRGKNYAKNKSNWSKRNTNKTQEKTIKAQGKRLKEKEKL